MLLDTESCLIPRNIQIKYMYSGATDVRLQNRSEVYFKTRVINADSPKGATAIGGRGGDNKK